MQYSTAQDTTGKYDGLKKSERYLNTFAFYDELFLSLSTFDKLPVNKCFVELMSIPDQEIFQRF